MLRVIRPAAVSWGYEHRLIDLCSSVQGGFVIKPMRLYADCTKNSRVMTVSQQNINVRSTAPPTSLFLPTSFVFFVLFPCLWVKLWLILWVERVSDEVFQNAQTSLQLFFYTTSTYWIVLFDILGILSISPRLNFLRSNKPFFWQDIGGSVGQTPLRQDCSLCTLDDHAEPTTPSTPLSFFSLLFWKL